LLSTSKFSAQALHDSNDDIVTIQLNTTTTTHSTNTSETAPKQTKSIATRSTPIATTTKGFLYQLEPSSTICFGSEINFFVFFILR
jgi:hypothetical protein